MWASSDCPVTGAWQIDFASARGIRSFPKGNRRQQRQRPTGQGGKMKCRRSLAAIFAAFLGMILAVPASQAADGTIKIGYIDPFSGAFAAGGDASLKMFQFIIDNINAKGGALGKKFELVTFDDKLQPAE